MEKVRKFWISCSKDRYSGSYYIHAVEPDYKEGRYWYSQGMINLCTEELNPWLGYKHLPLVGECIEFKCEAIITWLPPEE